MLNHTRALSDENKGRIHASFSSNPHWKYDWGAFGAVPLGKNESVSNHGDGLSVKTWSKARDGLLLWLDASDVDGDGKTDAVREPYPLSTWVDKAGKDHDAKPFEEGEKAKVRFGLKADRPNLGMVHFDGNGSMIFPKIDKVRTLVCVVERGGKCPTHTTFIGNSASSKTWGYHGNHRIRQYGLRSVYEGLQRRDGEPIKFNQGGSFLKQLQITVLVTKAEVTADWLGLRKDGAGNRYFMGNYAEIMIYDRPLGEPEILSIEKYLSDKWGIAIKHDGTNRVGDFPWVGNVLPVLAQGDSPPKQKEKPAKMVTGAVIMASLTLPVDVLNVEMKKKLPAGELKPGKVIQEGYEVKVGAGGEAVLLFSNGALTTLGEKTTLKITKFVQDKFTEKEGRAFDFGEEPSVSNTLLDLARGDLVVEVKKLKKKSNFEITTPLGVAGIRGTRFTINLREMNDAPDSIAIAVTEGAVYCKPAKGGKPAGKELSLNAGEAIDYSSSFSETALADLKPVKFDLGKENEVAAEPPPSLVSLPEILKALNEVNSRGNLSPKLSPFQKMRQKKVPRKR